VLVGERWRRLFTTFRKNLIATPDIYDALTIVATPQKAAALLRSSFGLTSDANAGPPQSLTARAARSEPRHRNAKRHSA
jgi:hypothetical protein